MMLDANAALIVIDMQQGFDEPVHGRRNNPAAEANGLALLDAWRRAGRPVVIVRHDSVSPDSTLNPGHRGHAFKPGFAPLAGDTLIAKTVNSAFIGTRLESLLRGRGITQVVLFGITTDQCVSTTARMAANLGFSLIVAGDACACFDQTAPDGRPVTAEMLHLAHLTTLGTEFGRVVATSRLIDAARRAASP